MTREERAEPHSSDITSTLGEKIGWVAAWGWTIAAGGGGLWLMWTKGPWPLTNGWFALASGLASSPATEWLLRKYAGIRLSGLVRVGAAVFFFIAGKIALKIGI